MNLPSTQEEPKDLDSPADHQAIPSAPLGCSPVLLPSVFPSAAASLPAPGSSGAPQADAKSDASEENGEAESEPLRNGAGHTSETESSDSGAAAGDKENSTGAPQDVEGEETF